MKTHILIIISFILLGCTTKKELAEGIFHQNYKLSKGDTLHFDVGVPNKRNWNYRMWTITKDSIFQDDSRGISRFLWGGKRKYSFKNDTLTMHAVSAPELETCVRCYLKSENTKHDKSIHIGKRYNVEKAQFLVLKSTKNVLQVVYLHTYQPINDTMDSDIELR